MIVAMRKILAQTLSIDEYSMDNFSPPCGHFLTTRSPMRSGPAIRKFMPLSDLNERPSGGIVIAHEHYEVCFDAALTIVPAIATTRDASSQIEGNFIDVFEAARFEKKRIYADRASRRHRDHCGADFPASSGGSIRA
jgi:hypothetical protein